VADQEAPAPVDAGKPSKEEKEFARRAAQAERDTADEHDKRREALGHTEIANYEGALGAPVTEQ
jgi:hypothetical protein